MGLGLGLGPRANTGDDREEASEDGEASDEEVVAAHLVSGRVGVGVGVRVRVRVGVGVGVGARVRATCTRALAPPPLKSRKQPACSKC